VTHVDVVVVGAGLAGLTAALAVAEGGKRVLVLAHGVGSTHLAPATIDVLGYAPDLVESPAEALPDFIAANPSHPYARVGVETVAASIAWLREHCGELGYVGGLERNRLMPTAVGAAKPCAAVPATMAAGELHDGLRLAVVGFEPLKDFYPALVAANLSRLQLPGGGRVDARPVVLSASPREGEADVGTLVYARALDGADFRRELAAQLRQAVSDGETLVLPAMLGTAPTTDVLRELEEGAGAPLAEIPTLPPSLPGIRLFGALTRALRRAGGRLVIGTRVVGARTAGGRVEAVVAEDAARRTTYWATSFVLATGGVASGGIELASHGTMREAVFDLPLSGLPGAGELRFLPGYFEHHPANRAGVAVDRLLRPVDDDGAVVYDNLHAAGATLAGAEPWREKSGDGVALASGYRAAQAVLEEL
jgi:glycerol-3-phosphate dehydrogenase subunit B